MARIRVRNTDEVFDAWQIPMNESMYPGEWETDWGIYFLSEIRIVGRHAGEYDPEHWGEKDPDAYDRQGYGNPNVGRHLFDSGVN